MTRQQIAQQIGENTPVVLRSASFLALAAALFWAGFAAKGWMQGVEIGSEKGAAALLLAQENREMFQEFRASMDRMTGEMTAIKELLAKNLKDGKL